MYHSVLDSVKVRRLPDAAQLDFVFVLCLASEYRERTKLNTGQTGLTPSEAAWRCRRDGMDASIHLMERNGLVAITDGLIVVCDWEERQYESDDGAARVQKHRERKRNVTRNVTVAPPETDTEADTDTEKKRAEANRAAHEVPRGYLLTADFKAAAAELRPEWDAKQVLRVFHDWRDHHVARGIRLKDFSASWRKWVRNEKTTASGNGRVKTLAERNRDNMDVLTGKKTNVRTIEGISARVDSATVLPLSSGVRQSGDGDVGDGGPSRSAAGVV